MDCFQQNKKGFLVKPTIIRLLNSNRPLRNLSTRSSMFSHSLESKVVKYLTLCFLHIVQLRVQPLRRHIQRLGGRGGRLSFSVPVFLLALLLQSRAQRPSVRLLGSARRSQLPVCDAGPVERGGSLQVCLLTSRSATTSDSVPDYFSASSSPGWSCRLVFAAVFRLRGAGCPVSVAGNRRTGSASSARGTSHFHHEY